MSLSEAPIEVEIGDELIHIAYVSSRNDTSSEPVLGLVLTRFRGLVHGSTKSNCCSGILSVNGCDKRGWRR